MRLGILGAGSIGEKHAETAAVVGVEVGRVVDADADRAAAVAGLYGAPSSADPQSLWDDATLDAVLISVPNRFHKDLAIRALRAGKDVLLEKPMAMNAEECAEIEAVVRETGRHLQIGHVQRYSAVGSAAKAIAESGDLGDIYHAKAHLHLRRAIPGLGGWFTTKALSGGGALIDLGVHLLDLSLHLLGQPTAVAVIGKAYSKFGVKKGGYVYESMWAGPPNFNGPFDVDDHATAMITFDSGTTLDLQVAWACNLPEGPSPTSVVALLGDRAGLSFELSGDHLLMRKEVSGRNADVKLALPTAEPMARQISDFAKAVESGQAGIGCTPTEGSRVMQLVDAIYRSSETNLPVTL